MRVQSDVVQSGIEMGTLLENTSMCARLVGRLVGWLVGGWVGPLTGWLVGRSVDRCRWSVGSLGALLGIRDSFCGQHANKNAKGLKDEFRDCWASAACRLPLVFGSLVFRG